MCNYCHCMKMKKAMVAVTSRNELKQHPNVAKNNISFVRSGWGEDGGGAAKHQTTKTFAHIWDCVHLRFVASSQVRSCFIYFNLVSF